ncbi:MAG: hypothetical protein EOP49_04545 [Sphingobacteriales bacterium]|nr:MAG: hypothetical protein EOP49_04545 [Sphingobacteriales bacterium]
MKFISLVLSVIVLTLTAMPCCAFEGGEAHAHKARQIEKHACNEQDDDCCKDCSPFYVCGTCIGFTVTTQQVMTFAIQLKPVLHGSVYVPVKLQMIPITIWQPPKLS